MPHPTDLAGTSDPAMLTVTQGSLSSYFHQRLADLAASLEPPPHEDTCWYLGSVLDRFGRSEELFAYEDGRMLLRPLAQLYGDALEARNEQERCLLLQQLGDMALFIGALFPRRYARRGIRQDYFVGMGGGAYDYLADKARNHRHVYAELARTFSRMLELVAQVCCRRRSEEEDVLELYRGWLETRDPATAARLRRLGVVLDNSQRQH